MRQELVSPHELIDRLQQLDVQVSETVARGLLPQKPLLAELERLQNTAPPAWLLESAVAAPRATMMGRPMIEDPIEVAASYLFYLCRNHPFVDGNKRAALATYLVFLSQNGLLPEEVINHDALEAFVLDVAAGRIDRG